MFQRRRCCVFDSPGLPNDSVGYPGLMYGLWGTTPSVLCFFWLIRHESPRYNHAFSEKAQHLQRWISLRTLTRGRLVPRQPRAIKRTTRTELRDETIVMLISLIIKCKTICVISSCKIRQTTQGRLRFRSPTLGYQRYNAYSVAISINTGCVSIAWGWWFDLTLAAT